ncbi:hypothetical protein HFP43_02720 [Streptomyces sp. SJ1-7]|nr:hypothetical protein [Streptomyces sp. SJ1-7]
MIVRPVVEKYAEEASSPAPPWLAGLVADTEAETELPAMMVGSLEGEFLAALVFALRPRRILEIGTFTGYSALCMAETMPADAELLTCELSPLHASIARKHFGASPWADRIHLLEARPSGRWRACPAPSTWSSSTPTRPGTSTTTRRCCPSCPRTGWSWPTTCSSSAVSPTSGTSNPTPWRCGRSTPMSPPTTGYGRACSPCARASP